MSLPLCLFMWHDECFLPSCSKASRYTLSSSLDTETSHAPSGPQERGWNMSWGVRKPRWLLHNPPKLSEPEFPYLKMGNSKPAYLLVSSRGSDEITHVKNTPITTQIAVPITILKIVPVRCFVLLSLTGMKKKNTKISFSGPKMVKWYYFGCSF